MTSAELEQLVPDAQSANGGRTKRCQDPFI